MEPSTNAPVKPDMLITVAVYCVAILLLVLAVETFWAFRILVKHP